MQASVLVNFKIPDTSEEYEVNLELPTSKPTGDSPFKFKVVQKVSENKDTVLDVAIGGEKQVYVAVAPPKSLLDAAKVGEVIQNLNVVVSDGNYNSDTGKFVIEEQNKIEG